MIENNFNPNIDLIKDNREMYHLKREKDKLYRDLKDYFMNINDINVI